MHRCGTVFLCACLALLSAGCPKGKSQADYGQGRKAESIGDLDAALNFYNQALKADPNNADLKIKVNQLRFEASEVHIKKGCRALWPSFNAPGLSIRRVRWRNRNCAGLPR
jgi:tetratricopeptide (TPR) repeat protein